MEWCFLRGVCCGLKEALAMVSSLGKHQGNICDFEYIDKKRILDKLKAENCTPTVLMEGCRRDLFWDIMNGPILR